MTISSNTRRAGPFTGNSVTVAFPFAFKVFAATEVLVVETVVGVEIVKTLTTHYTVALNSDQNISPGGTVTMLVAPTAAQTITLGSQVPNLQPTDLTAGGGFYPPVLNDALDRATIQIQQLQEQMSRGVSAPISTPPGVDYELPLPLSGYLLGWNVGATALENVNPATLGGGGGGGGTPTLGGINVGSFTLNQSTTTAKYQVPNTLSIGWNLLPSRMTVDCEFICNNYFLHNPGGHVALVTRCDTDIVESQVSGQGAIFGDLTWSGFDGDEALFKPTAIIETWDPTKTAGERYLFPNTTGPRGIPMVDGLKYRWIVESTLSDDGRKYIRYRLYKYAGATKQGWDLLVDTGDVLDHNTGADLTNQGLVFGYVLGENLGTWSIDFSNVKVTWGPPGTIVSDNATQLSKFGADLSGDLTFVGTSRTIRFPFNGGPSLVNSLAFQSSQANTNTTVVLKPNGSSVASNFLFSNNSNSSTTYGAVSFGMDGTLAKIETFGLSASDPRLQIHVGVGNQVAQFWSTGLQVMGAALLFGPVSTSMTGMNSIGGSNAVAFAASSFNFEWASTDGNVRTLMSGAPSNVEVEQVVRPLYCFLSCLLAELRNRKAI